MFINKELDYSILWQLLVTQKREVTKEEVGMKKVFWTFFRLKFSKTHLGGVNASEYHRLLSTKIVIWKSDTLDIRQINCRIS